MELSRLQAAIIDGYLDEPSCLGVPPYISPHVRYLYGALLTAGLKEDNIEYHTIDQLRKQRPKKLARLEEKNLVITIAGTTVPGNYLGGKPISLTEIKKLGQQLSFPRKILGGPITLIKKNIPGFDHLCSEIAAVDIFQLLTKNNIPKKQIPDYISHWAQAGAELTTRHPHHPYLVCELETFRGCPRSQHCHFCSEQLKTITYQRQPEDIIKEVRALATAGVHHFRLGCQTDLLLYGAKRKADSWQPDPSVFQKLYSGIREADPQLKVLHLDNINPGTIADYPHRSREILEIITRYNTPGDTAAFGLESADTAVLEKNNIATDPQKTMTAIKIMNQVGGKRKNGLPLLLPGLNFLHALKGETPRTRKLNFSFLKKILNSGLLLRRINIRQVAAHNNYPRTAIDKYDFRSYKKKINREINQPLLKKVFPRGTILKDVLTEEKKGQTTFGRQLGTYPILIGIPGRLPLTEFKNVRVIDHGYRSITALPWPFRIKEATIEQLTAFPGIGDSKAGKIFVKQPSNKKELRQLLQPDFPFSEWEDWFVF